MPQIITNLQTPSPIRFDFTIAIFDSLLTDYLIFRKNKYKTIDPPDTKFVQQATLGKPIISTNYIDNPTDLKENIRSLLNVIPTFSIPLIPLPIHISSNITIENPSTIFTFIEKLPVKNQTNIKKYMIEYSFLRSYIDFYHDFEYLALVYVGEIINGLTTQFYSKIMDRSSFMQKIQRIDGYVRTNSGGVNQTACKKILKQFMEEYSTFLISQGVYWLTPTKESAFICEADINVVGEIAVFLENINKDGIKHFYIETDKSHIAELLIKHGLNMVKSISGIRDAGSGITDQTAQKYASSRRHPLSILPITRKYDERATQKIQVILGEKQEVKNIIINNNNALGKVSDFLFNDSFNVIPTNGIQPTDENIIIIVEPHNNNNMITIQGTNTKCEQFSVNKLLATINEIQLRGEGNSPPLKPDMITTQRPPNPISILMLKSYTDYIQQLDVYDIKDIEQLRVTFVTLDILCNDSGMLFGLNTILSGINSLTYYCFDTRYHSTNIESIQKKYSVFNYLKTNVDMMRSSIPGLFSGIKTYLLRMNQNHYNPAIYYSTFLILNDIIEIEQNTLNKLEELRNKDLQSVDVNYIKLFPETVKEYLEQICQFSVIRVNYENVFDKISSIMQTLSLMGGRITEEVFIEKFYNIKQEIINSLPTTINTDELNIHIIIFFAVMISLKTDHARSSIFTLFTNIQTKYPDHEIVAYLFQINDSIHKIKVILDRTTANSAWLNYRSQIETSLSGSTELENTNVSALIPYNLLISMATKRINDDSESVNKYITQGGKLKSRRYTKKLLKLKKKRILYKKICKTKRKY